jgi:hypothetical protein
MAAAPERTWWERNLKWVLLAAVLLVLLCLAAFVGLIFIAVVSATRSSEVYRTALMRAQAHPGVVERLGQPVEPGLLVQGRIETDNRQGEADLAIPISGPRGEAEISLVARKRAGIWHFEHLEVRTPDGTPIELLTQAEQDAAAAHLSERPPE